MAPYLSSRRRAWLFALLSVVMLAVAASAMRSTAALRWSGLHAAGIVTALRLNSLGTRSSYDPLVRFTTPSGDIIEFESAGSKTPDRRVGEAVKVLYAADHPTHAMIDRGALDWLLPALLALFALPIALFALRVLLGR